MNNIDPATGQVFSYDYQRFVLQNRLQNPPPPPIDVKPFDLNIKAPDKSDKTKKDLQKQKDQKDPKDPKDRPNFMKLI